MARPARMGGIRNSKWLLRAAVLVLCGIAARADEPDDTDGDGAEPSPKTAASAKQQPQKIGSFKLIPPGTPEREAPPSVELFWAEADRAGDAAQEADRAPASERIEAAAGLTLDDIQDPAAEKLLEMLMLQVEAMELEVVQLKKENREINDRLALTEEKAETFHTDTKRKLDQLVTFIRSPNPLQLDLQGRLAERD